MAVISTTDAKFKAQDPIKEKCGRLHLCVSDLCSAILNLVKETKNDSIHSVIYEGNGPRRLGRWSYLTKGGSRQPF